MAYTRTNYTSHTKATPKLAGGAKPSRATIYQTGLFKPTKEGVKSLGSIQVKEDVVIKAGSYINLYEVDDKSKFKNPDNAPDFTLKITEGKLSSK